MASGTITLTNNSDAVTGAGTAFLTDLAAGDFIVANVGGIAYTLPVTAIISDTALTIVSKFTGPTMNGLAWFVAKRDQQAMITAALVAQSAEALRGLNYDKQNWQAVFSAAGDITVTMPDGTQFTGPSWKKISDMFAEGGFLEAEKNLSDVADLSSTRVNLKIDRINQGSAFTSIVAPQGDDGSTNFIDIRADNDTWGAYKSGVGPIPLAISNGGTGETTNAGVRRAMEVNRVAQRSTETLLYSSNSNLIGLMVRDSGEWGCWDESYQRWVRLPIAGIPAVGSVSQSSGNPTGSIIETGTNANGTYTKFADGTMICRYTHAGLVGTVSASGNIFTSTVVTLPFPAQFSTVPDVSAGAVWGGQSGASAWCNIGSISEARVQFQLNSAQSNGNGYPSYIAVGRWF